MAQAISAVVSATENSGGERYKRGGLCARIRAWGTGALAYGGDKRGVYGLLVPVSGEFFRHLHHDVALACDIVVQEIVRVDKSKYRNGGENRDKRPDELSSHVRNSNRLSLPQYETCPKSF